MQKHEMFAVQNLPWMFNTWKEYRDYLTEKLITIEKNKAIFKKEWARMDDLYAEMAFPEDLYKKQIASLLVNDWEFVKIAGFLNSPAMIVYRDWKKGKLYSRTRTPASLRYVKEQYR